jgi:secondary thiamine-phosphate synthase enzyme
VNVITVKTERKTQLLDITSAVTDAILGHTGSFAVVFVPHTTAGIVLQAAGEGAHEVAGDVETAFTQLVAGEAGWRHSVEGDRNPESHIRASLTASSITIPLDGSTLALGRLQHIFLAEFDGPRERSVYVSVAG